MTPIATTLPMTILRIEWHDHCVSTSIQILLTRRMTQFQKMWPRKISEKVLRNNNILITQNLFWFLWTFLLSYYYNWVVLQDSAYWYVKTNLYWYLGFFISDHYVERNILTQRKAHTYQQTRTYKRMAFTFVWVSIRIWMRLDHF